MDEKIFNEVTESITTLYHTLKENKSGMVTKAIPRLSEVNPDLFAISIVTTDGRLYEIGDTDHKISVQSCCKTMNFALMIQEHGMERVLELLNVEPSGRSFDDSALDDKDRPFNALINAGAILAVSTIRAKDSPSKRFSYIENRWSEATGEKVQYDNTVYLSEYENCDKNLSIVHKMLAHNSYPKEYSREHVLNSFQLYLQCCSLKISTTGMARYAALLANSGIHPGTQRRFFQDVTVQNVLTVMDSSGMYNYSGRWGVKVGVPAKSGISGLVYMVIPGEAGIAIYSPRLDNYGNSVRAVNFAQEFAKRFNIHKYNFAARRLQRIRANPKAKTMRETLEMIWACARNDTEQVMEMIKDGVDVNQGDYDGRRPLHLASEKAELPLNMLLLDSGADPLVKDNGGRSPLRHAARYHKTALFYRLTLTVIRRSFLRSAFGRLRQNVHDEEESDSDSDSFPVSAMVRHDLVA